MIKHRATTWPSNSTVRYTPQSNEIYANTKTCVGILTAALIILDKMWGGKPKYQSVDKCRNKMWYIHTMKYYLAIKRSADI